MLQPCFIIASESGERVIRLTRAELHYTPYATAVEGQFVTRPGQMVLVESGAKSRLSHRIHLVSGPWGIKHDQDIAARLAALCQSLVIHLGIKVEYVERILNNLRVEMRDIHE